MKNDAFSCIWSLIQVTRTNRSIQGTYCFKCRMRLAARTRCVEKRKQNHLLSIAIKAKFTVLTGLYFILHCRTSAYLKKIYFHLVEMVQYK